MAPVEDARCTDGGLLDFLDHLTDWARDLPVFVLVFARAELGQVWQDARHRAEPHYTDWARLIVVAVLYGLAFLTGLRRKTAAGGPFSVR